MFKPLAFALCLLASPIALAQAVPQPGDPGTYDMRIVMKDPHGIARRDASSPSDDAGKPCAYQTPLPGPSGDKAGSEVHLEYCPEMTLASAAQSMLYNSGRFEQDKGTDGRTHALRARLADRIGENPGAVKLSASEIETILRLMGWAYDGPTMSQAYRVLNPNQDLGEIK
jgi:hypothetical protein